jgi:Ion channel
VERTGQQHHDLLDALLWATPTVTTVGYGDRFPVTDEGRLVCVLLMVVGIGVSSSIAARWQGIRAGDADQAAAEDRILELEATFARLSTRSRCSSPSWSHTTRASSAPAGGGLHSRCACPVELPL